MSNSKRILAALLAGAMELCAGCGKEEKDRGGKLKQLRLR